MIAGRRVARLLAALALTPLPALWFAGPASAASCSVSLSGLLSSATPGTGYEFDLGVVNSATDPVSGQLRIRHQVTLPGLSADLLRLERQSAAGGWTVLADKPKADGEGLKAIDPDVVLSATGTFTGRYRLTLLAGAPTGTASVSAVVQTRTGNDWIAAGKSPKYLVTVAPGSTPNNRDVRATPGPGSAVSGAAISPSPPASGNRAGGNAAKVAGDGAASNAAGGTSSSGAGDPHEPSSARSWPARYRSPAAIVAITLAAVGLLVAFSWVLWRRITQPLDDPDGAPDGRAPPGGSADPSPADPSRADPAGDGTPPARSRTS